MTALDWKEPPPELRNPLLVYSFKGWNDAGESASAAVALLIANLEGRLVAEIDPEEFFDFTAVRPTIRLTEGMSRVIEWPSTTIHVAQIPAADRDLVLMQGAEPSLRWRTFGEAVVEAAQALGVEMVDRPRRAARGRSPHAAHRTSPDSHRPRTWSTGSGWAAPTTRAPPASSAFSTPPARRRRCRRSASGPRCRTTWRPPRPNPKAALELVRRRRGHRRRGGRRGRAGGGGGRVRAPGQRRGGQRPRREGLRRERLEAEADEHPDDEPTRLPSGDSIARDFQRYLRQKDD